MKYEKLGELAKIKTGKLDANMSDENGKYPFFTCSIKTYRINNFSYDCECVLVAGNGDLNVKYYDGKFDAYQRTYIIESINKEVLNTKFLYYFLCNYIDTLRNNSIGGVIKYIKLGDLTDINIPLLSLDEQLKIVSILDKAKELMQKSKEALDDLDELIKSRFIEMFGDPIINTKNWDIKNLGELGYFKNGMNYKQSDSGFNIKFLGVGEFKYGNIINSSNMLPTLELQEKPKDEYLLKDGDIVFVRSNGSKELVGRSVLVKELEEDTTYSGFCIRYRNKSNEITPEFLINLFSDEGFKSYFKKDSRGANINNLNQQMLSSLNIILPPIELQNQFADFIKQANKLKVKMDKSLNNLEDNFNSLMQKSFKGNLFR